MYRMIGNFEANPIVLFQGENTPFKPYTHRYHVPYKTSQSSSPLWYSIKRASAYIIVLSSYSAYGTCWFGDEGIELQSKTELKVEFYW